MFLSKQMKPNLRFMALRFSHISGSYLWSQPKPHIIAYNFYWWKVTDFQVFPACEIQKFGPYIVFGTSIWNPYFATLSFVCANNGMIMHSGRKSISEWPANYGKIYYQLSKVSMRAIRKKSLWQEPFTHKHSYWLITYLGCKLSYDWSLYTMPAG